MNKRKLTDDELRLFVLSAKTEGITKTNLLCYFRSKLIMCDERRLTRIWNE